MRDSLHETAVVILLALVFTIGLTFASIELPYQADALLQRTITTPGGDSHASALQLLKTELFISHFHLRLIGYLCFAATLVLIVVGFATQKSSVAALGAVALMLPVFAQFAGVMFFLAGLGILNLLWLPVLDVSFDVNHLGLIIRAPYDLARWLLGLMGINAYWPLVYGTIAGGLLLFFLGTVAWLKARLRHQDVADSWVYRFSRHPQYLGWILWTYGLFLLLLRARYPKRSWGIDASLPWLISTMVIIGVAMIEELQMSRRFGERYEAYRRSAPFLFPLPAVVGRVLRWPFRLLFGTDRPQRPREVVTVLSLYTVALVGLSVLFYGGGIRWITAAVQSETAEARTVATVARQLAEIEHPRERYFKAEELAGFGSAAAPFLVELLQNGDAGLRQEAARVLGELRSKEAVPALIEALEDPDRNVRFRVIGALGEIEADEAAEPILGEMTDPDPIVRIAAGNALAQLGVTEARPYLVEMLGDSLVWIRSAAIEALGTLGDSAAVPALVRQLGSDKASVRRSAVVALMQIGSAESLPALRGSMEDEDWEVRVYATEAVRRLESARGQE